MFDEKAKNWMKWIFKTTHIGCQWIAIVDAVVDKEGQWDMALIVIFDGTIRVGTIPKQGVDTSIEISSTTK